MPHIRTIVAAKRVNEAKADLYLPQTAIRTLNIPAGPLTVQFGSRVGHGVVQGIRTRFHVAVGPSLVRTLLLPVGVPIRVRYLAQERRLVFGPLIGVLLSQYKTSNATNPFGIYTTFLNELASLCRIYGAIVCVFAPDDVNWDTQTIKGMVERNGTWHKQAVPLPQCIYNRLSSREAEQSDQVAALIQRFRERQIPFFNQHFLNKWQVHQALAAQPEAAAYLPRTVLYESIEELKQMLREHRTVYAKPTNGSMGKGIVRVSRQPQGYWLQQANGRISRFPNALALHRQLQKLKGSHTYLLQQSLPLIRAEQRAADFRALVQKNKTGQWGVTSLVARLGSNSVVSNVARGGSIMSAVRALHLCGPWKQGRRPTPNMLKQAALRLAAALERALPGHYAEFGIDLGVDTSGRIWLLEVNSKPSKAENTLHQPMPTDEPAQLRRPRPSVRKLMEYTAYVSGFPYTGSQSASLGTASKKRSRR